MPRIRRWLLEYGVTVAAVGVALLLRWLIDPILEDRIPFAAMLGAVAVAVGIGGLGPALVAIVLGYLGADLAFVPPRGVLSLNTFADWITLVGYLFASLTVMFFGLLMRRANRKERAAALALTELNQRKDRLLATVAHELRNPLTPIRNALELLHAQVPAPTREQQQALDIIDRQTDRLARLVGDLVDMDRIARNQLQLRKFRVSLVKIVAHAIETSRPLLASKQQQLTSSLPLEPLYIEADADRVEQALVNLLANASKFTPTAGIIDVSVQHEGTTAVVRITDSGCGISEESLPRIFEMFYQADPSRRGLGIGLSLVRQLIDLHGGTVSAHSDGEGKGSEFVVRLALSAEQRPVEDSPSLEDAVPGGGSAYPSREKIELRAPAHAGQGTERVL